MENTEIERQIWDAGRELADHGEEDGDSWCATQEDSQHEDVNASDKWIWSKFLDGNGGNILEEIEDFHAFWVPQEQLAVCQGKDLRGGRKSIPSISCEGNSAFLSTGSTD